MAFRKKQIVVIICCLSSFLFAEQFIIKKKKGPSASQLKEQCCERYARIMHDLPVLLHAIADLQTKAITVIGDYCEGNKESSFQNASKEQLVLMSQTLSEIESSIAAMRNELTVKVAQL